VAAAAARSSRSSSRASWASAVSGRDHLQDPPPQHPQGFGVVVGGEVEEMLLGPLHHVGVEVGGEVVEGAQDHLDLLDQDPTVGEGGAGGFVGVQAVGDPHQPAGGCPGGGRGVGVPPRGRRRGSLAGEVDPVGVHQQPGLELGQLGLGGLKVT
jgi:hypothetical protein